MWCKTKNSNNVQTFRKSTGRTETATRTALSEKLVRPSIGLWRSWVSIVAKKTDELRTCKDYRALNKRTIKSQIVIQRTDVIWVQLGGADYSSTIDLRSGYHQDRMRNTVPRTAFQFRYGQFEYHATLHGVARASGCLKRLVKDILKPCLDKFCFHLDDILGYSKTRYYHFDYVKIVHQELRKNQPHSVMSEYEFLKS